MTKPTAMIIGTVEPVPARKSLSVLAADGGSRPTALETIAWKATRPPTKTSTPRVRMTTPTTARRVPPTTVSTGLRWRSRPTRAMIPMRIGTWLKMLFAIPVRTSCTRSTMASVRGSGSAPRGRGNRTAPRGPLDAEWWRSQTRDRPTRGQAAPPSAWRRPARPPDGAGRRSVAPEEVRDDRPGDRDVDDEHSLRPRAGPLPHDVGLGEPGDPRTAGAERAAERGEVDVVEQHPAPVDTLDAVLVQLGPVGGVVEHDDDAGPHLGHERHEVGEPHGPAAEDRKSTRLNSSHVKYSYAV